MMQLYFLSILLNGLSGYFLFTGIFDESETFGEKIRLSATNPTFQLVMGILCIVIGVLKLLSPIDRFPVLGDLVPALAGVVAGFILIFGVYRKNTSSVSEASGALEKTGEKLLRYRKVFGIGLLVVALLHFIFPAALFL